MSYVTDDFRKKIMDMFPYEKAMSIINEFNAKLREEEEALQEIGFTGSWTYKTGKTEITANVTKENNTHVNISINDGRTDQKISISKNSVDALMHALFDLNKKINPYKMSQARSRINIMNDLF